MNEQLIKQAAALRDQLAERQQRLILTESCTGGWLAASLASLPGISQWWCGSLVVYRCGSKQQWLGIDQAILDDPEIGPVSQLVTRQLAEQALRHTTEADLSLAVTGDLGPGVPADKDGRVFCALAERGKLEVAEGHMHLQSPAPRDALDIASRVSRLEEASLWVLKCANQWLADTQATASRT